MQEKKKNAWKSEGEIQLTQAQMEVQRTAELSTGAIQTQLQEKTRVN